MKGYQRFYLLVLIALAGCSNPAENEQVTVPLKTTVEGELHISGADALHPLMMAWVEGFNKLHPKLTITVASGGTGHGIDMLMEGTAEVAMVSRRLTPAEESLGFAYFPVSREGVIPIVSDKNPFIDGILTGGLKRAEIAAAYRGDHELTWGSLLGDQAELPVHTYTRSDRSGAAESWASYLGIPPMQLAGIAVTGDEQMIRSVVNDSLAIGYCNAHFAYDFLNRDVKEGLQIIPLDFNENGQIDPREKMYDSLCCMQRSVYLGTFPTHLCREMALVTIGIPENPAIVALLQWIYDEGQTVAKEHGYPQLRHYIIRESLIMLEKQGI
jgi:phosphate transport system substrate-binding protein